MKLLVKLFTLVFSSIVLAKASAEEVRPSGPTRPSQTEYFTSAVAMVLVARDAPTSILALSLLPNKPLPVGSSILVEFEDPADNKSPFMVSGTVNEKGELHVQSPKIEEIRNKRAYLTRTKVIGPDNQVLSEHIQWIWFEMPDVMRKVYATKVVD
ncbi:hypothetical protein GM658_05465 [Pseudoduganella eburnea]|uniref:Uncharacterized protein n=1 Tax=Massilia eburnea TaxID=1776165 RepID=A0A6L6QED2_9BURK|nr:hypothetical protein [Massilia eburnea]MTW10043.1 hypothetical protein [Massilia eburnea]